MTSSIYKLFEKFDKLEIMLEKDLAIPFTSWVIVNHDRITDILDKIRASIPGEVEEARRVLKASEEIQAEAQRKANQLLTEAKQQAENLLSESELLKAVQAEAERIRQQVINDCEVMKKQAQEESEAIKNRAINESINVREGADKYAESVLSNLDRDLTEMHEVVKNGQKQLSQLRAESISVITAHANAAQNEQISV